MGLLLAVCLGPLAGGPASAWTAQNTIRVVADQDYPPYLFRGPGGALKGILVDQWNLWERKTGIHVQLDAMIWAEAQRRMLAGEYDVIDTIFETESRRASLEFGPAYARLDVPIYFNRDLSGISGPGDLAGFVVGAKRGDSSVEVLKASGVTTVALFDDYESIIAAAQEGKLKVFTVDKPPAMYYLIRMGILDRFRESEPLYSGAFHRAVRRGNTALLAQVQAGFEAIPERDYRSIERHWLGAPLVPSREWRNLALIAGAAIGAIGLLLFWVWILRRMVESRTADLAKSNLTNQGILEAIPDLIFILSRSGELLAAHVQDPGMLVLPLEAQLHRSIREVLEEPLADRYMEGIRATLASRSVQAFTYTVLLEGQERHFEARLAPSGPDQVVAIIRDVTETWRVAEENRKFQKQLSQTQKIESLGRLAGGLAHDMNNILTAIGAVAETLKVRFGSERNLVDALATIERAASRGRDLVKGMTNFVRKEIREAEVFDLNLLVGEEADLLRRTMLQKIELVLDLEDPLPLILGDRGSLGSALMNLCVNAMDAMPQGGVLVLRTQNAPNGVRLEVQDSGEGMSPEVLERAVEPFFTTKAMGKGTGLGLAAVYATVAAHGGTLALRSQPGLGTAVTLEIPSASPRVVPPPGPEPGTAHGGPLRILLVDDDDLLRITVPGMLESLGHKVEVMEGGGAALAWLDQGNVPDVVILDMNMPGMNGMEVLHHIRNRSEALPVLFASGFLDEGMEQAIKADSHAIAIAKPFTLEEIGAKLAKLPVGLNGSQP